ncbi:uncharacterized protein Polr2M [Panulirus ornatus]|uniref:uncharacterized protein Polr2M n=1 Tax=Panulirus ornatus TaxID=150431 RepID=UPI003A8C825F
MNETPLYKCVNKEWKTLSSLGDDVAIRDPKLKEGYLGNLSKKSVIELEEVLIRHDRILSKKGLLSKLKDKGLNLQKRRQEVAEALEAARHRGISETADSPTDITALEWNSTVRNGNINTVKNDHLDSDDEEEEEKLDPLRLMAYHSSCVKKPLRKEPREEEDPSEAIVQELEQLNIKDSVKKNDGSSQDFGTKRDIMLAEKHERNGPIKVPFKPFRRTNNPQPVPGLLHHTSACKAHPAICISQQESLKLEHDYLVKDKERALKDASEQLCKVKTEKIGLPPPSSLGKYRDRNLGKHILDSDEEEEEDFFYNAVDADIFDDGEEYFSDC